MRARLLSSLGSVALVGGLLLAVPAPAQAAAPKTPSKITSVSAKPGPGVGEITFSWKTEGDNTTEFQLETALTLFSKTDKKLPAHGRHAATFTIAGSKRSFTMSAAQAAAAGAPAGSGNHLFFRLAAVNEKSTGSAVRAYPKLSAAMPRAAASAGNTHLRIASFNVRTAKATGDKQGWMKRRSAVAKSITAAKPQVVTIQELGPGRADGKAGSTTGTLRQTDSLTKSLAAAGGSRYKLVRSTPYVAPGNASGTQGARILFDSSKVTLLSICSETTNGKNYSNSCSIKLPILSGDKENARRHAAYAKFRNKQTGEQFYVVSAHLDERHSKNAATEKTYNALRGRQADYIIDRIAELNSGHLPVVFGGDINSWQNNQVGNAPHDALVSRGFYDTAAAVTKVNVKYPTINHFAKKLKAAGQGFAPRIDVIMVKGGKGASKFVNDTRATDSSRPSDHNLIYADTAI